MSTIINADTSDGLKFTSDTSGEIKLQSAGADIATVDSSGITMASGKGLAATGHVLQVVQGSTNTQVNTTSTSYVSTSLTASITPSSTTSKILVNVSSSTIMTNVDQIVYSTIYRGATNIGGGNQTALNLTRPASAANAWQWVPLTINKLDSPSTTSSTTYTLYFKVNGGSGYVCHPDMLSTITLIEVAG